MALTTSETPRDRLLQTAGRLFYAEGIHAVGINRVLAVSGVAKRTLYRHFATKEDMVAAYLQDSSARFRERLAERLADPDLAADDRVLIPFDLLAEAARSDDWRGCPFINAGAEYSSHPAIRPVIEDHRAWLMCTFRTLLAKTGRPDALATGLNQLYDGALVSAHLDGCADAPLAARATAARLLWTLPQAP